MAADVRQPSDENVHRSFQCLLILSILLLSWLGMMIVHEFGHLLAAWVSGATVTRVVLHPLEFSRTDLASNPHALFVAWGGAAGGTILPLCMLWVAKVKRLPVYYLFQLFAGFCLVANGIYLSVVSFLKAADAGDLMRHGTPQWILVLFGIVTVPVGHFSLEWLGSALWPWLSERTRQSPGRNRNVIILMVVIVVEILSASR